jgi:hypothetical protein
MKPIVTLTLLGCLALASPLAAQPLINGNQPTPEPQFDFLSRTSSSTEWRHQPDVWNVLSTNLPASSVMIGKQEIKVGGSVVEKFRGRSLKQAPASFFGLFVPQRMSAPTSGGKYLAWGDSQMSWTAIASGRGTAGRNFTDPVNHEADWILFSGGR